jgi:Zn-dependent alcohol dehydrogenase
MSVLELAGVLLNGDLMWTDHVSSQLEYSSVLDFAQGMCFCSSSTLFELNGSTVSEYACMLGCAAIPGLGDTLKTAACTSRTFPNSPLPVP